LHQGAGFFGRIHHGADHAIGAGIQHLADDARFIPRHAHHGGYGVGLHALKARHAGKVILHAMLHIHRQAIPARLGEHFRRKGIGDGKPPIGHGLAGLPHLFDLIRHCPVSSFGTLMGEG